VWYPLNYQGLEPSCRPKGLGNRENNGKNSRVLTMLASLDDELSSTWGDWHLHARSQSGEKRH